MKGIDPREVGARIRAARERAGLTQSALGEAAGVAAATISRIERGAYEPSLTTTVALARALGLRLDLLVFGPSAGEAEARPIGPDVRRLAETADRLSPADRRLLVEIARCFGRRRRARPAA